MAINLDFEVSEELTYCDKTQQCALIAGMPYPLFLYVTLGGPFITWLFSFGAFIALLVAYFILSVILRRAKVPFSKLFFYLNEKKSNRRRALSKRRHALYKHGKRL